jgi:NAD(P)-dependent dehydrogenase (short-subunit alcohol dehydrogenase family)
MKKKYSQHSLFDLSGKTALVTGSAGTLGREFCKGLAESGADIMLVDLNYEIVQKQAAELTNNFNIKAKGYACDVSVPSSVKNCVTNAINDFGSINILHNNAACKIGSTDTFFAPFEDYSLEQWRSVLNVNLDGMFLMAQAVGKHMLSKGGGSIIQTSSIYGLVGPDHRIYEKSEYQGQKMNSPAVYGVSKAGIIGLTKYLATYWAKKGIRVNAIAPGGVFSGQNENFIKNYSSRVPIGRMAETKEIVGAMLFLASNASTYMTGQTLIVDGGLTSW